MFASDSEAPMCRVLHRSLLFLAGPVVMLTYKARLELKNRKCFLERIESR